MEKTPVYIIVATDKKGGIGLRGQMPWNLPEDMQHFTKTTTETRDKKKQNMVIMGQNTWESLPEKYRPLPDRKNIVLSFNQEYIAPGAIVRTSFEEAFKEADEKTEKIFIMGGASVYKFAIETLELDGIYLTQIDHAYKCDTFFPKIPTKYKKKVIGKTKSADGIKLTFLFYKRK